MLLRYLETVVLKKSTKTKQPNGTYVDSYETIDNFQVTKQVLESDVDVQVYGSNINKMYRLISPHRTIEKFLLDKLNNTDDNISKYYVFINEIQYKINAVTPYKVDIERI